MPSRTSRPGRPPDLPHRADRGLPPRIHPCIIHSSHTGSALGSHRPRYVGGEPSAGTSQHMPPTRQAGPLDRTFSTAIAMEKTDTPPASTTAGTACTGAAMGAMRNPHDIAVCKTGQAAAEWAQAHNVDGYVTVDIGDGSKTFNKVPNGRSDLQGDKDGEADVILWAKGRVYIWEVKPNETSGRFRTALRSLARNSPGPGSGVQYGPRRITGECGTTAPLRRR